MLVQLWVLFSIFFIIIVKLKIKAGTSVIQIKLFTDKLTIVQNMFMKLIDFSFMNLNKCIKFNF